MMKFCQTNKLLNPVQNGFRNKMSCTDAIGAKTENIRDVIDKKLTGQTCFIDLQRAFDTIDQKNTVEKNGKTWAAREYQRTD